MPEPSETWMESPPVDEVQGPGVAPGSVKLDESPASRLTGPDVSEPVALFERLEAAGFDVAEVWATMHAIVPETPREQAVTVAYVMSNRVTYSWHHSIVEMIAYDMVNSRRIIAGGYAAMRYGTDGLVASRNRAVAEFLTDRAADWLFWIDSDMGFAADTVDRLMAAADPVERPIVGGLCFSMQETATDGLGGWQTELVPTIYDWTHEGDLDDPGHPQGFAVRWDYPANSLVRCSGTGSACVLIHRSVFERIALAEIRGPDGADTGRILGPRWYDKAYNVSMGQETSEDLSFCMRALAAQIPVHVLTGVRTTHEKTVWASEEMYWRQRAADPRRRGQSVPMERESAG